MNKQDFFIKYVELYNTDLKENGRALSLLQKLGITDTSVINNFNLGIVSGKLNDLIGNNKELITFFTDTGILKDGKEMFTGNIVLPVYDESKAITNIIYINPENSNDIHYLNAEGIFNSFFLRNSDRIIFTDNPVDMLLLLQAGVYDVSFIFGDNAKYSDFIKVHNIRKAIFAFEGKEKLFFELTRNGVSTCRIDIDFDLLKTTDAVSYIESVFNTGDKRQINYSEIENGFLFKFPHLSYRVIGSFTENSMRLKANIKAFNDTEVFTDSIELYKNRDRQNFVFNIMNRFNFRDQVQLENDLNNIIDVIEGYIEKKANEKKKIKPELTDDQKDFGIKFLQTPDLIEEISNDISKLGYVREHKNKVLLYLVMTSRLMDNPLHTLIVSRSGAGKSRLVDIVETLCPPEELESISDLSAQALFYFGIDDLKHKFIVIGEKEGSRDSDYPLRELISRKSITKAIPVKDHSTGQIKTVTIKVNGPIALVETTTSGEVNPENLNRYFVMAIDETEEPTELIHDNQRINYTLEGHLSKKELTKIREKHIYAQRLLKKVNVFNPYAPLLTFPTSRLQTRRDNEKLLRLINSIAFLHQYQRKIKTLKLDNNEILEYIECNINDYRIAYELLKDGLLDNTLDDLPRPARELFDTIKKYVDKRSKDTNLTPDKITFERKEIREFSSWSFAQVRNNVRILKEYEYLTEIKSRNGLAHQYKISGSYSDLDFLNTILTPEQLEKKIMEQQKKSQTA